MKWRGSERIQLLCSGVCGSLLMEGDAVSCMVTLPVKPDLPVDGSTVDKFLIFYLVRTQ